MRFRFWFLWIALLAALGAGGWHARRQGWLALPAAAANPEPDHPPAAPPPALTSVALTDQAIKSLGIVSKPVKIGPVWRTLSVPGAVIDRAGVSDRGVSAPTAGVVVAIHAGPGDFIPPGAPLFTVRLVSEAAQAAQSELFKATEESKIVAEQLAKVEPLVRRGALEEIRATELEQQQRRQQALVRASRHDLAAHGLSAAQVAGVEAGRFVAEIAVPVPALSPAAAARGDASFEVQALSVELGQQVQAGQELAQLSDHRLLTVEGRAFKHEAALIEAAAAHAWPVEVEFLASPNLAWPAAPTAFPIRTLGNNVDPVSRTFPFQLALENQARVVAAGGRNILVWRHRPGQKVRLSVPVRKLEQAIAVPGGAVARDGAEHIVFRHNGNVFERVPVQVEFEERDRFVLAADGAVLPGSFLAQNQASALLRALKAQAPRPETAGGHWHADGSFHATPHGKDGE